MIKTKSTDYRFGRVWCNRHSISIAIGPKRSHLDFTLEFPVLWWGWYGGPDWYHRWRRHQTERKHARAK